MYSDSIRSLGSVSGFGYRKAKVTPKKEKKKTKFGPFSQKTMRLLLELERPKKNIFLTKNFSSYFNFRILSVLIYLKNSGT